MSVWRLASGDPRVASRSGRPAAQPASVRPAGARATMGLEVEERAQRLDEPLAPRRPGGLLQEHRRVMEHLGQGRLTGLVDLGPLLLAQPPLQRALPIELGHAERLRLSPTVV